MEQWWTCDIWGQGAKKKKEKGHQLFVVGQQHAKCGTFKVNWKGTLEST